MTQKTRSTPDLLLLLSLFSVILLNPILDHGDFRKLILAGLTFIPVIIATLRLSQKRLWVWPSILLMSVSAVFGLMSAFIANPLLATIKWGLLAAFFALTVVGLFSYLTSVRYVLRTHLYTAVSVYLLLGMTWFALYCAIDAAFPGSFQYSNNDRGQPTKRTPVLQPDYSHHHRLWRHPSSERRSTDAGRARGRNRRPLCRHYGRNIGQRL